MLCWPWPKTPPFFQDFLVSLLQMGEGEKKKGFLSHFCIFSWCFDDIHRWYSVNFLLLKNLSRVSLFQLKPPGTLLVWGKCKIYREICTGAGWKSFQSPMTFLFIPIALMAVAFFMAVAFLGGRKRKKRPLVQCSMCVPVHTWDAAKDLAEPVCTQPICLL